MSTQAFQSCETLLQAMVGFDTVTASVSGRPFPEQELAHFMESQGSALGFATKRLPMNDSNFNLLVSCHSNAAAPWLLFDSHLDTVSVEGMTIEPFAGQIRDGRIYGRGSCDTKGTGAAMLCAMRRYAEGVDKPNNIAILYSLDEEGGKTGIRTFVDRQLPSLSGPAEGIMCGTGVSPVLHRRDAGATQSYRDRLLDFRPAGVIVGEPTLLEPVVAHNGVVRWAIQTQGTAVHSSDPSKGRSAISMMIKVIEQLESRYIPSLSASHPLTGKAQCSINMIRGGVQINIIPELCEIRIDRRVVPGEDANGVLPAVEALLEDLRRQDAQLKVSQQAIFADPPLDPRGSEAFIDTVRQALHGMDMPSQPCGVGYGTNASTFAEAGIPAVVLGPGNIAQAHSRDEWLDLGQLHKAVEVYLHLMRSPLEKIR